MNRFEQIAAAAAVAGLAAGGAMAEESKTKACKNAETELRAADIRYENSCIIPTTRDNGMVVYRFRIDQECDRMGAAGDDARKKADAACKK